MVHKDPKLVYLQIPDEFLPVYHWFNVCIPPYWMRTLVRCAKLYRPCIPMISLRVKLDVDSLDDELRSALLLLTDLSLWQHIDVFYFEHHVHMQQLET